MVRQTSCLLQEGGTTKDTKSAKLSKDKAFEAVLQPGDIEVHQQSGLDLGQLHVGQQLRLVKSCDLLNALQFDDQFFFDQHSSCSS